MNYYKIGPGGVFLKKSDMLRNSDFKKKINRLKVGWTLEVPYSEYPMKEYINIHQTIWLMKRAGITDQKKVFKTKRFKMQKLFAVTRIK